MLCVLLLGVDTLWPLCNAYYYLLELLLATEDRGSKFKGALNYEELLLFEWEGRGGALSLPEPELRGVRENECLLSPYGNLASSLFVENVYLRLFYCGDFINGEATAAC